ncbi:Pimeloyl-ACP methyl ester carboxylesterase [Desulfatibacillum alkenivorans DSM 16219]|jgi:pimeloyl-ACP methyl ester carboxylesterase|uniref:Pimeloyl-ACP methyl ester carboxylesterase n=1 Tax=Desulfatibacillum alkenivorans DSM 16219 TaxID=1121393 RepID=A0A1M6J4W2_9BACT|nr:alpha/beta hydrolase [Desulfatibacillum alkenivorans]SHJ41697.1 Pimeloyl-ACP methyl ester carboxylesterase [Desulfatibacillum alkenivorans DSM 16219]
MHRYLIVAVLAFCFGCASTTPLDNSARSSAPGSFVQLSQGMVHYSLDGPEDGEAVVLVHGFSTPMFIWERTVPALTDAGFRVLTYDLYGRGYSDRPDVKYNEELFDSQLEELLEALDIQEPVNLLGLSMGGAIVTIFTARHPEKVRRTGMIAPAGFPVKIPFTAKLVRIPGLGDFLMSVMGDRTIRKSAAKSFYDQSQVEPFLAKFDEQMKYKGYKRAILRTLKEFNLNDQEEAFKAVGSLGKPVLLIWGENDQTVPYEHHEKVMAAIPQTQFHSIEKAAHVPHYEKNGVVSPIIVGFFED